MFKPLSRDDAVIVYNAQNNDGKGDFISLAMKDGYVEFRFDTGKGKSALASCFEELNEKKNMKKKKMEKRKKKPTGNCTILIPKGNSYCEQFSTLLLKTSP